VELFLTLAFTNAVKRATRRVRARIKPHLGKFAAPPEEHKDADPEDEEELAEIADIMRELRKQVPRDVEASVEGDSDTAAKRTVQNSKSEFERLGIKLLDAEPDLGPLIDAWRAENVGRITGMLDDELDKIETILRNGDGLVVGDLADALEDQLGVSESRANLIARDQVLTLNGQITKERQGACGIEKYVWTTSNDERVRETHAELEGTTQSWDDPPEINDDGDTGHPGEDYQCRCIAFPILPELDDDEKEPTDEEDAAE